MKKVVILDGEQRASLAVTRSLASRGTPVCAVSSAIPNLSGCVRRIDSVAHVTAASKSIDEFLKDLSNLALSIDVQHLIPVTDTSLTALHCADLPNQLRYPFAPDRHSYEALSDKAKLFELALRESVPIPYSKILESKASAVRIDWDRSYPVILKPGRSKVALAGRVTSTSVSKVGSPRELEHLLSDAAWFPTIPAVVQEFIPGHGAGVFCLYDRDHAIAWFAHQRIREKPPSGGVSVLCESVPVDPLLKDYAERLLRAAEYRGVAMVEFRIAPDGKPYLMEVNARFWGSLQLAIDCGVDFPWLYYQMLMGEEVEPVIGYQVGRRLRWFLGDLDHLLIRLRDPREAVADKIAAVGRFLGTGFDLGCRQEVFRWSDPRPGWFELQQWIANVACRTQ